jgi:hypothetical protein
MRLHTITITVTELQEALQDYAERHTRTQPEIVIVDNGFDKIVLRVPLTPGAVVQGEEFMRQTEAT